MKTLFKDYFTQINQYRFDRAWGIDAPVEKVWAVVTDFARWPEWWQDLESIVPLTPQLPLGKDSRIRSAWQGPLPYRLTFDAEITRFRPYFYIGFRVSGDLEGFGNVWFSSSENTTHTRFLWQVSPTPVWIRMSAPFAHFIFKENHDRVMDRAFRGMEKLLD